MTSARRDAASRTLIVAAAGYGRTTALDAATPPGGVRLDAAALIDAPAPAAVWLGVDDLDRLAPVDQRTVLGRLSRLAPDVGFAVTTRHPLSPALVALLPGLVRHRGPADLALTTYGIAVLLAEEYGVQDPEAAVRVHAATAGWPALVHFAGDTLAHGATGDLATVLARPGGAAAAWLRREVLAALPRVAVPALAELTALGPVTEALCADLAAPADRDAVVEAVRGLHATGVLVTQERLGDDRLLACVPVVARLLAADAGPASSTGAAVGRACERRGLAYLAARAWARAGAHHEVSRLLLAHGPRMIGHGHAAGVVELLRDLPQRHRPAALQHLHADALRTSGDTGAALRELAPGVAAACRHGWDSALVSRLATAHFTRGDPGAALSALDLVPAGLVRPDAAGVALLACRAQVLATLGRDDEASPVAAQCLSVAEQLQAPGALATAHLAGARVSTGTGKQAHHEAALLAARAAGDAPLAVRVLVNQTCQLLAAARYAEACVVGHEAVRLAEVGSPPGRHAIALHNLGEALCRVGEHGPARWHLERSIALCRRLGPGRSALGLVGLGDVHRELSQHERARAAYQEAVALGRDSQEAQVLVPALSGLARTQASADPAAAHRDATEAERLATPALRPFALVALGLVALARHDDVAAAHWAQEAAGAARAVQAYDLLAEALEVGAQATSDPTLARAMLSEALAIWQDGGARPAAARVHWLLGRTPGASGTERSQARDAARYLQRLGITEVHGRPVDADPTAQHVVVAVLGRFVVTVGGQAVPVPAWRSRQARTLVKVLAARRGRVVTRPALCELLWPDDDPQRTGHRLSVLLATVRGVLDPDRRWPSDRYVGSDQRGLWLDLRHVAVDTDALLRDADLAAELVEVGDLDRAREVLTDVDVRYRGDAFEEDAGEEWADGPREEVRTAWLRSVRRLARLYARLGRPDDAQVLLVRLLANDPYDVRVHQLLVQTLVRAGRHGEAQRAFDRWASAMAAIDVPCPDRAVLGAPVLTPR